MMLSLKCQSLYLLNEHVYGSECIVDIQPSKWICNFGPSSTELSALPLKSQQTNDSYLKHGDHLKYRGLPSSSQILIESNGQPITNQQL